MNDYRYQTPTYNIYPSIEQMLDLETYPQISTSFQSNLLEDSPINKKQIPEFTTEATTFFYGFDDIIKLEYEEPEEPSFLRLEYEPNMIGQIYGRLKQVSQKHHQEFHGRVSKSPLQADVHAQEINPEPTSKWREIIVIHSDLKNYQIFHNPQESVQLQTADGGSLDKWHKEAPKWIKRSNKLQLKQLHLLAIPYMIQAAKERKRIRFPIKQWRATVFE